MGSGVVHIGEEWDPERMSFFWTGRFTAHWESDEDGSFEDGPEGVSAAEAIEWGRARADIVLIRPGDADVHYSAGIVHPESAPDNPILPWDPATELKPRWQPGYEHLGIEADQPIEWEARLPVPDEENRTTVVVWARSHEEAWALADAELDRLRGWERSARRLRLRDRLRRRVRGGGIYVVDSGFDPADDLRPKA